MDKKEIISKLDGLCNEIISVDLDMISALMERCTYWDAIEIDENISVTGNRICQKAADLKEMDITDIIIVIQTALTHNPTYQETVSILWSLSKSFPGAHIDWSHAQSDDIEYNKCRCYILLFSAQ